MPRQQGQDVRPSRRLLGAIFTAGRRRAAAPGAVLLVLLGILSPVAAQESVARDASTKTSGPGVTTSSEASEFANQPLELRLPEGLSAGPKGWASPEGLSSTLQVMLLLTVLSLAPAILMMTTCFVRLVIVLSLVRQAVGTQQLPPSQVITTLSLFLTLLIMMPVWKEVYDTSVVPYTNKEITGQEAWTNGIDPIRRFMVLQIERTGNTQDVWLFLRYSSVEKEPESYEEVPLVVLLPAFMLSELKTAFLIGFQIYLPFVIVDMVIAAVMVSMGMLMLPPAMISLPFKLLLFVLLDGWHLVVGMLMESFQLYT